jgi:hypothetical protein
MDGAPSLKIYLEGHVRFGLLKPAVVFLDDAPWHRDKIPLLAFGHGGDGTRSWPQGRGLEPRGSQDSCSELGVLPAECVADGVWAIPSDGIPDLRGIGNFANSEVTWVVYPFSKKGASYRIGVPEFKFSTWDNVQTALREGVAPESQEILEEIRRKQEKSPLPIIAT